MDLQQQKVHIEKAQNFMRQYRDPESRELKKLSANQFMDVWSHYDGDGNGYIEGTELDGFLKEFVSSANATDLGPESLTDEMLVELKSASWKHTTIIRTGRSTSERVCCRGKDDYFLNSEEDGVDYSS
ncbi:calbindin-32-like [Armigeres subalbatus]|uniref:calbindin-32-like n=1 Tax=Armigeres subalbatus TaxID=124917 RepID=UPI002ED0A68F